MKRCTVRLLVAVGSFALTSPARAITFSFDQGVPPIASPSANLGVVAGGLAITDFSALSGSYLEGYVDLNLVPGGLSIVSDKELLLGVIRANSISDGDFEAADVGSATSAWTEHGGGVSAVSTGRLAGYAAELEVPAGSSTDAYFQQYFPTNPGDVYRLSYRVRMDDMLPAYGSGAYGTLEVRARYGATAADAGMIHPATPTTGYLGSTLNTDARDRYELIARHTSATGTAHITQPFAVADCDEHVALDDGVRHIGFYRYSSANCASAIQYAGITFNAEARAPASAATALVDDVFVDWVRQVEVEILDNDAAGPTSTVIQSSTVDTGFYVAPLSPADHPYGVTLRVWLRTHEDGVTPILRAIELRDAMPVQVVVGNAVATIDAPRLGLDMHVPPKEEFDDYASYGTELSTQCYDPLTSGYVGCYELFADYGLQNVRMFLDPADFDFTSDGTDYVVTPNADGLNLMERIAEARAAGLDPLVMIPAHGPPVSAMSFWDETCTDVLDDDPLGVRDDAAQSRHLFSRFAQALIEGLDGTHADFAYAQVDHFEILNEPNYDAFEPYCTNFLPAADLPLLIAEVSEDLASSVTRTGYELSFGGLEPDDGYMYDVAYLRDELLPVLDPLLFTHTSFHPYTKTWAPEHILDQFPVADTTLDDAGWSGMPVWFTEFAYKRATYDPDCASSLYSTEQSEWVDRGYGDAEQAALMARATVSALTTNADKVIAWGQMSNEMVDDLWDPCWESLSGNKTMFARDPGTGSASGGTDPTTFSANPAGLAYLTLGHYLSSASPMQVLATNASWGGFGAPDDEHVYARVFQTATGYAVAVNTFKDYDYGRIRADLGETTDIAYQNLVYDQSELCTDTVEACGVRDVGFRELRKLTLGLTGLVGGELIQSVRVVALDGSFTETPLDWSWDGSDVLTVKGVVAGELPVLVLLDGAP